MLFLCSTALVRTYKHNELRRKRALFELIFTMSISAVGVAFYVTVVLDIVQIDLAASNLDLLDGAIPFRRLSVSGSLLEILYVVGVLLQDGFMVSNNKIA